MIKKEEFCHPRDESKTVCSDQSIHGANVNGDDIDDKNYDDEEFMCVCVCVCVKGRSEFCMQWISIVESNVQVDSQSPIKD